MSVEVENWDGFRASYDEWTLKQHQDHYDKIYDEYPSQRHYDLGALLDWIDMREIKTIVELGGWNGELAAAALHLRPGLESWTNFEICAKAALERVPTVDPDPRYLARVPTEWFWEIEDLPEADCFVASHTIEHLSYDHWAALIQRLPKYKYLFLDAPLHPEIPTHWAGSTTTHVLPLSWLQVTSSLWTVGFDLAWTHWKGMVHCYGPR